jgi:uncharacterized protein with ParB-like and HNH nuclease domain
VKVHQPDSITELLSSSKRTFAIPVYQRNYVWKIENCEKVFDDVLTSIESSRNHYFGNVVYYVSDHNMISSYTRYILIDGQQRITTIMLLLAAIRDEEDDEDKRAAISNNYLKNENAEEEFRIKLKQVETDRIVYEAIIDGNTNDIDTSSVIYRNYKKFRGLIKDAKQEHGFSSEQIMSGVKRLHVIGIDLESEKEGAESPQVIFESINATGEPLSTADLLRNFLLLEVGTEKQEEYYKNYWLTIEKNIGNENISDYIRRYLTLKRTEDIKKNTEYTEFKRNYKNDFNDAEGAIRELTHFSQYYKWIKNPESIVKDHPKTSAILQDLDDLRMLPATPAIMWLLEKADNGEIDFEDVNDTLDVIGAWSFRARITNIISTGEIGTILTTKILELLKDKQTEGSYADYIWYELSNYRVRDIYPNDTVFKEAFVRYDFYKNYRTYVQLKLETPARERANMNDKVEIEMESIEHIMPQTIRANKWPGVSVSEHAEWVNTIGNLTPMNMIDNPAASNDSIKDKRPYIEKSAWQLTKEVDTKNGWGIEAIQTRAKKLAGDACTIWRAPKERTREIELVQRGAKNNRVQKFMDWINELDLAYINIDESRSSNSYIRLTTDYMSKLMPARDTKDGGWKSGQAYYYELRSDSSGWVRINLGFNSTDATKQQQEGQKKVMVFLDKQPPKADWQWFNAIGWTLDYDDGDEVLKDEVERVLADEIPRFEHELAEFINNQNK